MYARPMPKRAGGVLLGRVMLVWSWVLGLVSLGPSAHRTASPTSWATLCAPGRLELSTVNCEWAEATIAPIQAFHVSRPRRRGRLQALRWRQGGRAPLIPMSVQDESIYGML